MDLRLIEDYFREWERSRSKEQAELETDIFFNETLTNLKHEQQ